jgi:ubiquinone/menaquinone biosynthesis C-methylase UbiE
MSMNNQSSKLYGGYYKYDVDVAKTYESDREIEEHWGKENVYVKNYMANSKWETLLDLPVGTGRFLSFFNNVSRVVGIDISDAMLSEARGKLFDSKNTSHIELVKGDVFDLKYADDTFNCSIIFRLLHLLPPDRLESAINELCRVTKE